MRLEHLVGGWRARVLEHQVCGDLGPLRCGRGFLEVGHGHVGMVSFVAVLRVSAARVICSASFGVGVLLGMGFIGRQ